MHINMVSNISCAHCLFYFLFILLLIFVMWCCRLEISELSHLGYSEAVGSIQRFAWKLCPSNGKFLFSSLEITPCLPWNLQSFLYMISHEDCKVSSLYRFQGKTTYLPIIIINYLVALIWVHMIPSFVIHQRVFQRYNNQSIIMGNIFCMLL